MSTVAIRSRAVAPCADDGSSGGGSTASMAAGSVSNTTVTAWVQIWRCTASTSRLRRSSGGRAP